MSRTFDHRGHAILVRSGDVKTGLYREDGEACIPVARKAST